MEADLVGYVVLYNCKGEAAYLPLRTRYPDAPEQFKLYKNCTRTFKPILQTPNIKKVGQHLKYDKSPGANYE